MSALRAVRLLNEIVSRVDSAAEQLGSVWKVCDVNARPSKGNHKNTCGSLWYSISKSKPNFVLKLKELCIKCDNIAEGLECLDKLFLDTEFLNFWFDHDTGEA